MLWPQHIYIYWSTWPIFHGLVILLDIFKIIWWLNILVGMMDQCDAKINLIKYVGQWPVFYGSMILLHISKTIGWRNVVFVIMCQCDSNVDIVKYYVGQWPVFHGQLILPIKYHCDRLKLLLCIKNGAGPGYSFPPQALAVVILNIGSFVFSDWKMPKQKKTEECQD